MTGLIEKFTLGLLEGALPTLRILIDYIEVLSEDRSDQ